MAQQTKTIAPLLRQVRAIVGPEYVTDESAKCDLATSDVFERSEDTNKQEDL
jgi:hypothetical protein